MERTSDFGMSSWYSKWCTLSFMFPGALFGETELFGCCSKCETHSSGAIHSMFIRLDGRLNLMVTFQQSPTGQDGLIICSWSCLILQPGPSSRRCTTVLTNLYIRVIIALIQNTNGSSVQDTNKSTERIDRISIRNVRTPIPRSHELTWIGRIDLGTLSA